MARFRDALNVIERTGLINFEEMGLAGRFAKARGLQGLTQDDCAAQLGLTRSQVTNIETARTPLRFALGWKFCQKLNINPLWLAIGEGSERPFVPIDLDRYGAAFTEGSLFREVCIGALRQVLQQREDYPGESSAAEFAAAMVRQTSPTWPDLLASISAVLETQPDLPSLTLKVARILVNDLIKQLADVDAVNKLEGSASLSPDGASVKLRVDKIADTQESPSMPYTLSSLLERARVVSEGHGKQGELAGALGVHPSQLSRWLNGKAKPNAEATLQLLNWVSGEETKEATGAPQSKAAPQKRTRK